VPNGRLVARCSISWHFLGGLDPRGRRRFSGLGSEEILREDGWREGRGASLISFFKIRSLCAVHYLSSVIIITEMFDVRARIGEGLFHKSKPLRNQSIVARALKL
jgi:hypothetical protein